MNEEEIRRFTEELRLSSEELQEFNDSLKTLRPTILSIADPLGKLSDAANKATKATEENTKVEKDSTETTKRNTAATGKNTAITEALTDSFVNLKNAGDTMKTVLGSVAGVGLEFADALLKNEDGLTKYSGALGSAGDAALEIGSKFGILGTIIGGLIKGATVVVEAQMKQADAQVKAVQDIAKLGGAGAYTTKEIIKLSHSAGYTIENFNKLLKPIQGLGVGIQSLGAGAVEGQREFIKLASVGKDTRMAFFRLGVSQEELTQSQADYVNLQRMTGRMITQQMRDSGELRKASLQYTLQLQELSYLTGLSVEESKKALQQTTNTIQMAAINADRSLKLMDLEERKRNATGEELVQIEKTIALLKAQEKGLDNANQAMAAMGGGKEAGAAMQQFLATGTASEEMARRFGMLGMDLNKVYTQFQETGKFDIAAFIDEYKRKMTEKMPAMLEGIKMAGSDAEAYAKSIGMSKDEIEFVIANIGKDTQQLIDQNRAKTQSAFEKTEDNMLENLNLEKENRIAIQTEKEAFLDSMNVFHNDIMPDLTNAGEKLTKLFETLATTVQALVSVTALGGMIVAFKKAASVFSSVATKLGMGGPAGGGLLDKLTGMGGVAGKLGRVARFVPGVGQVLGAGAAMYGAYQGISNAEQNLGLAEGQEATTGQRVASGMGGALSSLTLGMVDAGAAARGFARVGGMFGFGTDQGVGAVEEQGEKPSGIGSDQKLLDFIAKVESQGNYNVLVGGKIKTDPALTDMTVGEVLDFQKTMKQFGHESTAVGKYQIIRDTLLSLVNQRKVTLNDTFNQATQDKLAIDLLNRRGRLQYKEGNLDKETYADNIAKEWASMPLASGKSAHAGVGSNKALVTRDQFIDAISAKDGGIVDGPEQGYPATLHGNEIIVPLIPNSFLAELGKKTKQQVNDEVVEKVEIAPINFSDIITTFNTENILSELGKKVTQQMVAQTPEKPPEVTRTVEFDSNNMKQLLNLNQNLMEMLSNKLDNVILKLDTSNDTQSKILRYSQA